MRTMTVGKGGQNPDEVCTTNPCAKCLRRGSQIIQILQPQKADILTRNRRFLVVRHSLASSSLRSKRAFQGDLSTLGKSNCKYGNPLKISTLHRNSFQLLPFHYFVTVETTGCAESGAMILMVYWGREMSIRRQLGQLESRGGLLIQGSPKTAENQEIRQTSRP